MSLSSTGAAASASDVVVILYRNWRGETAVRRITPIAREWFGSSEWHPEPQWLFTAFDMDKEIFRDFARSGVLAWGQEAVDAALASPPPAVPESVRRLSEAATKGPFSVSGVRRRYNEASCVIVDAPTCPGLFAFATADGEEALASLADAQFAVAAVNYVRTLLSPTPSPDGPEPCAWAGGNDTCYCRTCDLEYRYGREDRPACPRLRSETPSPDGPEVSAPPGEEWGKPFGTGPGWTTPHDGPVSPETEAAARRIAARRAGGAYVDAAGVSEAAWRSEIHAAEAALFGVSAPPGGGGVDAKKLRADMAEALNGHTRWSRDCNLSGEYLCSKVWPLVEAAIRAAPATPEPAVGGGPFRVGRKVERHVYEGDRPLYTASSPEEAARHVRLLNAGLSALSAPAGAQTAGGEQDDWRSDPSADERWNAGLDFGMQQLCAILNVDPMAVNWDAATETLDGDVRSVMHGILALWAGDDWMDAPRLLLSAPPSSTATAHDAPEGERQA